MATSAEWAQCFARQAYADFASWQAIETHDTFQPCHRMMLLQMACEKLCKARLIDDGTPPAAVQRSHGYVANPLPLIIRAQVEHMGGSWTAGLRAFTRQIAGEIELGPVVNSLAKRRKESRLGIVLSIRCCFHRRQSLLERAKFLGGGSRAKFVGVGGCLG